MSIYQHKITRHTKGKIIYFEEAEQGLEQNQAEMLELLNQEFKTTMINMLRALMNKIDGM